MKISRLIKKVLKIVFPGIAKPVYADIKYLSPSEMLSGKKIIVTGGGKGLGFAMAKRFIAEGALVLITGRDEKRLKQVSEELHCKYIAFDVCQISHCNDFINEADKLLGGIDVLVNNAGISLHEESFFDVTPDTFNKQIITNFEAPFFLTQAFIKLLIARNQRGEVLFISSETGDTVDFRPYGYTKAAVNSMVKGLAYLFKKDNIRINAIAPGITATDMTGVSKNGNLKAGNYGSGRFYLPDEMAQVASLVISDTMGIVSGQVITCNNGQTVNARWR